MPPLLQLPRAWLIVALLLCLIVYWPGLNGGFVYDDFAFIVTNQSVHVESLRWSDWQSAANSFPAEHQGRWAGMLSFALNYYVNGLDPWGYKLANVFIHLLNGWLVSLMLTALLDSRRILQFNAQVTTESDRIFIALITVFWLILPINLTSVLYVGQRLESLSNTFVLLGLVLYLRLRLRDWKKDEVARELYAAVLLCTVLGLLVKESAVLLPLYIGCMEFVVFRFRRQDGSVSRPVATLLIATLLLPFIAGAIWLATWIGTDRAYSRSFDTYERLLTQARVLIQYTKWTLVPSLSELSLYHDDIPVSRSLWSPWTTLPAMVSVLFLLASAVWLRRRLPLFSLGLLLFFCGHALTSTVIPLMLAFEHRNYFPSIGLLLALASLLGLELKLLQPRMQWLVFGVFALFYLGTTQLRVLEWSDPIRLASSEAAKRPNSVDAQYDYARALIRYSDSDPRSPAVDEALARLRASRGMSGSGILFDHAILILEAKRGDPENQEYWAAMRRKAETERPRASDVSAVFTLFECMESGSCAPRYAELLAVINAFSSHERADARFHALRGTLMATKYGDLGATRSAFERAVGLRPKDTAIRASYVTALVKLGATEDAQVELVKLRSLDSADAVRIADSLQALIDQHLEPDHR